MAQQYDEGIGVAQALLEMDSHFAEAYRLRGCCHWGLADYAAAEMALQKAIAEGAGPLTMANLCGVYAHAGKQEEARQLLRQLHDLRERGYVPALWVAYCYMGLGEVEETFVWLEKALTERNGELVFLGAFPEWFFPFRQDPRFADLLRRIGLPE